MNNLTPNQTRIADAVATGRTVKEVADFLNRSPQTIFNTLSSIYERLSIPHNISALAVWRICSVHKLELPEFIRKTGALTLLLLFATTIMTQDDTMYRRSGTRRARRSDIEIIDKFNEEE